MFAYLFMASNYADGMPDGLTFKSEQQKQDLTYGASEKALTQFLSIAKQLGTHNTILLGHLSFPYHCRYR